MIDTVVLVLAGGSSESSELQKRQTDAAAKVRLSRMNCVFFFFFFPPPVKERFASVTENELADASVVSSSLTCSVTNNQSLFTSQLICTQGFSNSYLSDT